MDKSKWGITDTGFYRPTYEEIVAEKERNAVVLFGQDIDTGEMSVLGKFLRLNAKDELRLYEIAEKVYYSISPLSATGSSLDNLCKFLPATRNAASYSKIKLSVYGTKDSVISIGTQFKNDDGIIFISTSEETINKPETGQDNDTTYYTDVIVTCTQSGTVGNVTNKSFTLVKHDRNITSVVFKSEIARGKNIETDVELRERFLQINQGLGTNTGASIKANILKKVLTVSDVIIIDNNTTEEILIGDTANKDETDNIYNPEGTTVEYETDKTSLVISPRSYAIIVNCTDKSEKVLSEIANAIFEKQPLGILQSGNITFNVVDDSETVHNVKFSYILPYSITITVNCNVNSAFPSDGKTQIERNIRKYIDSLGIGEQVVYTRIFDYIYNVTGVNNAYNLQVNSNTTNIHINRLSKAELENIEINIIR